MTIEDKVPEGKVLCSHIEYCTIRKMKRNQHKYVDCFIGEDGKGCGQVFSFYQKYGEQGNQMGVGS